MNDARPSPKKTVPLYRFAGPRYWPVWLGLGCMRLGAALPYRVQMALGRAVGRLAYRLAHSRRKVATRNLEVCFPELDRGARDTLLKEHFRSVGIGLIEVALGWWGKPEALSRLANIHGLDHLKNALDTGAGVLLLAGHFTTIEIGSTILSIATPIHAMYRRFENPLFEEVMRRRRLTRVDTIFRRGEFRDMMRSLKNNNAILYMPDQAYVRSNSVDVPFFGVPAPTSTGTSRIVKRSGALVVPFLPLRRADGSGYELTIYPPLANFPSDDPTADAERLNRLFESQVREAPAQYLWIHRRFKGIDGVYPSAVPRS